MSFTARTTADLTLARSMSPGATPSYQGRRVVDEQPLTYSGAKGYMSMETGCYITETGETGLVMTMVYPEHGAGYTIVWDSAATPKVGQTVQTYVVPVANDGGAVGKTIIGQKSGATVVVLSKINASLALGPVSGGLFSTERRFRGMDILPRSPTIRG